MKEKEKSTVLLEQEKGRTLTVTPLVCMIIGNMVGAGLMTNTGIAAGYTGYSVWLAFIVAVLLGFVAAVPQFIAAGTAVFDGGLFTLNTLFGNPLAGGLHVIGMMIVYIGQASVALGIGMYIQVLIPSAPVRVVAVLAILFFWIMNMLGLDWLVGIQKYMSFILFAGLAVFTVFGLKNLNMEALNFAGQDFFSGGNTGFMKAVNMLSFSTQSYWVALSFSKYTIHPKKNVPKAMLFAMPILILIYGGVSLAAVGGVGLSAFAGHTLGDVAKIMMPKWLFYPFVICVPIMALFTTLNSNMATEALGIKPAADDGWFPKIFGKTNKKGMPYVAQTLVMITFVLPILFGWDIGFITSNVMLVTNLTYLLQFFAIWNMRKKLPELWKKSTFFMSNIKFLVLFLVGLAARFVLICFSVASLTFKNLLVNLLVVVILVIYCTIQYKRGIISKETAYSAE